MSPERMLPLIVLGVSGWGTALPSVAALPGQVERLDLGSSTAPTPAVYFGSHRALVIEVRQRWEAWIGVGLETPPGDYIVRVVYDEDNVRHRVINVKSQRRVDEPGGRALEASSGGSPSTHADPDGGWRSELEARLPLTTPAAGRMVNRFGAAMLDPNLPPHHYHDLVFLVPGDTLLTAPGAGTVYFAPHGAKEDRLVLCLDHGMGMTSCISPVLDPQVAAGHRVQRNTPLAYSATTRDDGPVALHWTVKLNGVLVDPADLLPADLSLHNSP